MRDCKDQVIEQWEQTPKIPWRQVRRVLPGASALMREETCLRAMGRLARFPLSRLVKFRGGDATPRQPAATCPSDARSHVSCLRALPDLCGLPYELGLPELFMGYRKSHTAKAHHRSCSLKVEPTR